MGQLVPRYASGACLYVNIEDFKKFATVRAENKLNPVDP
jgi:hypothetical protein